MGDTDRSSSQVSPDCRATHPDRQLGTVRCSRSRGHRGTHWCHHDESRQTLHWARNAGTPDPDQEPEVPRLWMQRISPAELERAGPVPIRLDGAFVVQEAATIARDYMPPVRSHDSALPDGWGIFPPRGVEPLVRLVGKARATSGASIAYRSQGAVGCMWNHRGRVVVRLWFRGESAPEPVDVYADQLGAVTFSPPMPGWEVLRLDG